MSHYPLAWLAIVASVTVACDGLITGPDYQGDTGPAVDAASSVDEDADPAPPDAGASPDGASPTPIDAAVEHDAIVWSGDFCESSQVVAMEAESYSDQNGYAEVLRSDASGGRAMQVGDGGSLDFQIFLTTPGTYYFWIRTLAPDAESNGLYVALDGELITAPADNPYAGVSDIYLKKSSSQWFWDPAWQGEGSGAVQGPVTFVASAGEHTLAIRKRKMERPLIDKVVLTVANAVPSGLGPNETACP